MSKIFSSIPSFSLFFHSYCVVTSYTVVCVDVCNSGGISELHGGAAGSDRHLQGEEQEGAVRAPEAAARRGLRAGEIAHHCQVFAGAGWLGGTYFA